MIAKLEKDMRNAAKLLEFDKDNINVEYNNENLQIERKLISNISAHIEF